MGFPEDFKIPVSDNQAYKQFGNAVVPPVVKDIAIQVIKSLEFNNKIKVPTTSIAKRNAKIIEVAVKPSGFSPWI